MTIAGGILIAALAWFGWLIRTASSTRRARGEHDAEHYPEHYPEH